MASTNDKRTYPRLHHTAPVLVTYLNSGQTLQLQMQDFSTGGVFVNCSNASLPSLGDEMLIQTLEFEEAPVLNVKVVRVIPDKGFAVQFLESS